MHHPKVSVLIPCYNAERYIGETLESVFRQRWPEIEVIVVDDGSQDRSVQVVRSFTRPNLRLVHQANRGSTAARNVCCSHATGEFVQYLDADDIIAPDKIGRQMERLLPAPNCIASAEWGRFYKTPAETEFREESVWCDSNPIDWLVQSGFGMMFPALWLIPMNIVCAVGSWNENLSLADDMEYFTRVVLASERVLFCPGARSYYRSGLSGSLSGRKSASALVSQFSVLDMCESYLRRAEDSERVRQALALRWQDFAHMTYPYDRDIAERAVERAQSLHKARIRPGGGLSFRLLSRLVGWRAARRLQVASGRP